MVADFSAASSAKAKWKGAMKLLSVFGIGFNSSKCKTMAKMTMARIKLLRNKRTTVVRQMRRDIALLLQSGQDATARIRVEHVIREQNIMAANEILELFCELIIARMSIISKSKECPADLKEGISSLIFAAPRCSDIPELQAIKCIFEKKYGKDFVFAATDLRPSCGVNRMLIDKLSVRPPTGETKLKIMKEIAKEHQVQWDYSESESELLKPPEELLQGSNAFVSPSSVPVRSTETHHSVQDNNITRPLGDGGGRQNVYKQFNNSEAAAEAASEAAEKAIAAAEAAAFLANKEPNHVNRRHTFHNTCNAKTDLQSELPRNTFQSQSFGMNQSHFTPDEDTKSPNSTDERKVSRRHSYNNPRAYSDIKFDDSGSEEESEMGEDHHHNVSNFNSAPPPSRPAPVVPSSLGTPGPRTHPNLPDYDSLAARFEALKYGHK
ncbi:hypothetical protein QQ045_010140 [Rhodiola kirilowii]